MVRHGGGRAAAACNSPTPVDPRISRQISSGRKYSVSISRRAVIASALAGTAAAGGVLGSQQASAAPEPRGRAQAAPAASPPGDVVGKISVGYQGWFACKGDGSPIDSWWHWSQNAGQPPSLGNTTIKSWPDVREYTRTFPPRIRI